MDNKLTRKQRINAIWLGAASLIISAILLILSQRTSDANTGEPSTSIENGVQSILSPNLGAYESLFMLGGLVAAFFAVVCFITAALGHNPPYK